MQINAATTIKITTKTIKKQNDETTDRYCLFFQNTVKITQKES
jgi:hypothetical protein